MVQGAGEGELNFEEALMSEEGGSAYATMGDVTMGGSGSHSHSAEQSTATGAATQNLSKKAHSHRLTQKLLQNVKDHYRKELEGKTMATTINGDGNSNNQDENSRQSLDSQLRPVEGFDEFVVINLTEEEVRVFAEYHCDFLTTHQVVKVYAEVFYPGIEVDVEKGGCIWYNRV